MHLAVLSTAGSYGGAERNLELLAAALAPHHRLTVFVEHALHRSRLDEAARELGFSVVALTGGPAPHQVAADFLRLRRHLAADRPDALFANTNKAALFAALLQRSLPGVPPAAVYVQDFQWQHRRAIFALLRRHHVLVPTLAVPEHPHWQGILRSDTVTVLPNLVVSRLATPASTEAPAFPFVLCLANYHPWKGIHLLIEAFARKAPGELHLVVAGNLHDRAYYAALRRLRARAGLQDRVHLETFIDDPSAYVARAAAVAVASVAAAGGPETFGRTIIEAWSHGRPVVAFACGGPKYIIRDGEDGYLVPPGDLDSFGTRLTALYCDPPLAAGLGEAGRRRAAAAFSTESISRTALEALDKLVPPRECSLSAKHAA